MTTTKSAASDHDPMNDEIAVIYPDLDRISADPGAAPLKDTVTRREFYARMDGYPLVEQLRSDEHICVIALLEADALMHWWKTR